MAQWIRRWSTKPEIPGSTPGRIEEKICVPALLGVTKYAHLNLFYYASNQFMSSKYSSPSHVHYLFEGNIV
mgnify:CR=1 FL=1